MQKLKQGDIVIRKEFTLKEHSHLVFKVLHVSGLIITLRNIKTNKVLGVGHYASEYRKITTAEEVLFGRISL